MHVNIYGHNRVRKIGVSAVKRLPKGDNRKGKRFCEYFLLFSVFNLNVNIVIRNRYISLRQIRLSLIVKKDREYLLAKFEMGLINVHLKEFERIIVVENFFNYTHFLPNFFLLCHNSTA